MTSRFIVFLASLVLAAPAYCYKLSENYWSTGTLNFYVGMPGISPGGISWSQSLQSSLEQWTSQTAFEFLPVNQYHDPCLNRGPGKFGDGITSAEFGTTACGQTFGDNVLAITLTAGICFKNDCSSGFDINDADILFNSNENWDVYTGPRRFGVNDFGRVALHELGHVIGLQHEDVNFAIMQATISNTFTLQADDINGANAIYGTAPARDDQSSNLLSSIYGINVILPAGSELTGASQNIYLTGALESSDGMLDGRHIDIFQYTITQDTQIDIRMESSQINSLLYLARMDS
ncbi:MAG: matrixin family metalloprotease, partial [Pseudohongiellaceae bacterium]